MMKSKEVREIVLAVYNSPNRRKNLVELLEHKDNAVRALAISWIGLEDEGFLTDRGPLFSALSDKRKEVRIAAVLACGRQKYGEIINIIMSSICNEELAFDELIANIKALALLQNPEGEGALLDLAKRLNGLPYSAWIQKYIAQALGWIELGKVGVEINRLHY